MVMVGDEIIEMLSQSAPSGRRLLRNMSQKDTASHIRDFFEQAPLPRKGERVLHDAVERYSMPYDWSRWAARYKARWGHDDDDDDAETGSDNDDDNDDENGKESATRREPAPGERAQRKVFLKTGLRYGVSHAGRKRANPGPASMPLPIGRVLDEQRDFVLPYNIYCPMGDVKIPNWKPLRKNVWMAGAPPPTARRGEQRPMCVCIDHCGDECLNRMLQYECDSDCCPFGDADCGNRKFKVLSQNLREGRLYARGFEITTTPNRGYGLRSTRSYKPGELILEYTGDVIDATEMHRRLREDYRGIENFYCLSLEKGLVIDSGKRGSAARFVNHSCNPNCEMQKWYVNDEPRIGLFAGPRPIPAGVELTYDYNFDWIDGAAPQQCHCGSENCRGFIGKRNGVKPSSASSSASPPATTAAEVAKRVTSRAASSRAATARPASRVGRLGRPPGRPGRKPGRPPAATNKPGRKPGRRPAGRPPGLLSGRKPGRPPGRPAPRVETRPEHNEAPLEAVMLRLRVPVKRGPGRPRKEELTYRRVLKKTTNPKLLEQPFKRKPGRPSKEDKKREREYRKALREFQEQLAKETDSNRGVSGNESDAESESVSQSEFGFESETAAPAPRRGAGRPRKHPITQETRNGKTRPVALDGMPARSTGRQRRVVPRVRLVTANRRASVRAAAKRTNSAAAAEREHRRLTRSASRELEAGDLDEELVVSGQRGARLVADSDARESDSESDLEVLDKHSSAMARKAATTGTRQGPSRPPKRRRGGRKLAEAETADWVDQMDQEGLQNGMSEDESESEADSRSSRKRRRGDSEDKAYEERSVRHKRPADKAAAPVAKRRLRRSTVEAVAASESPKPSRAASTANVAKASGHQRPVRSSRSRRIMVEVESDDDESAPEMEQEPLPAPTPAKPDVSWKDSVPSGPAPMSTPAPPVAVQAQAPLPPYQARPAQPVSGVRAAQQTPHTRDRLFRKENLNIIFESGSAPLPATHQHGLFAPVATPPGSTYYAYYNHTPPQVLMLPTGTDQSPASSAAIPPNPANQHAGRPLLSNAPLYNVPPGPGPAPAAAAGPGPGSAYGPPPFTPGPAPPIGRYAVPPPPGYGPQTTTPVYTYTYLPGPGAGPVLGPGPAPGPHSGPPSGSPSGHAPVYYNRGPPTPTEHPNQSTYGFPAAASVSKPPAAQSAMSPPVSAQVSLPPIRSELSRLPPSPAFSEQNSVAPPRFDATPPAATAPSSVGRSRNSSVHSVSASASAPNRADTTPGPTASRRQSQSQPGPDPKERRNSWRLVVGIDGDGDGDGNGEGDGANGANGQATPAGAKQGSDQTASRSQSPEIVAPVMAARKQGPSDPSGSDSLTMVTLTDMTTKVHSRPRMRKRKKNIHLGTIIQW